MSISGEGFFVSSTLSPRGSAFESLWLSAGSAVLVRPGPELWSHLAVAMASMRSDDLLWWLESWLQKCYGAGAILTSQPLDERARKNLPTPESFVWLSIAPVAGPSIAGIRSIRSTIGNRYFELIEWFDNQNIKRSYWRLDRFGVWQRVTDLETISH